MSVDLMLLPRYLGGSGLTVIELKGSNFLWREINKLPCHLVTDPIKSPLGVFEEDIANWEFRTLVVDGYDKALTWVFAKDLITLHHEALNEDGCADRAAWAYLAELPPETKVVLYWY